MKRLYAISDLHLERAINRQALDALPAHPEDWLIVAGDMAESEVCFRFGLEILSQRFEQLFWVPGNHELWTLPSDPRGYRGEDRYQHFVSICHEYGVLTPEDPYVQWSEAETPHIIAPIFTLYDYSFSPDGLSPQGAIEWAMASGILCTDEYYLYPDPYPSRSDWCRARCEYTSQRLEVAAQHAPLVLINHFPLRQDLAILPLVPRFSIWCGTRQTTDWHQRYRVSVVVYGHLHIRKTQFRDGVRFEEVSLGYPKQWKPDRGMTAYLREILPGAAST